MRPLPGLDTGSRSIPKRKSEGAIQSVRGKGAVGVQIDGDNNTVTIIAGKSKLLLDQPHLRRGIGAPTNERQLLLTEWRATTLVGRDDDLGKLAAWRGSATVVAVRCITGRAGSGKTRLAIEACEQAAVDGWIAGFASGEALRDFHAAQDLAQWRPAQDALVVVDDAAVSAGVLKDWFTILARRAPRAGERKLRILLLERHADPDSDYGWWANLKRPESASQAGAGDLIGDERPIPLNMIAKSDERRALLGEAMTYAARFLQKGPLAPPAAGVDPDFDRHLEDDRLENEPLFLVMAGIVAVEHGAPAALALGRVELAKTLAGTERARLARLAGSRGLAVDGDLIAHLCACVTIQRGSDLASALRLTREELAATGFEAALAPERLVELLAEALPGAASDSIDRVRPDLIGEAFFLREIIGPRARSESERQAVITRAHHRAETGVIESLVLAAQDFAAGATAHPAVRWLSDIAGRSEDLGKLMQIADAVPSTTLALRELAALVDRRIVEVLRHGGSDELPLLALGLSKLGFRLSALGQPEEALVVSQESVDIYRALAASDPDAFNVRFAGSLNNLSTILSDLGQREAALAPINEAIALRRAQIDLDNEENRANLASSLANLAVYLGELGQDEAALSAGEESVALYRRLAAEGPDVFNHDFSTSLTTLASSLANLRRKEEALAVAREAVDLRRKLAATNPDGFNSELATAITNFAGYLGRLGLNAEALVAAKEALSLYRALANERPDVFNPSLAASLNNIAQHYVSLGHLAEALAAAQEAVELRRNLAELRPNAFGPYLARSLSVLGDMLEANDRLQEAITRDHEAISVLKPFFLALPLAFKDQMTVYLRDYLRRSDAAQQELDPELVTPIIAKLRETVDGE